MHKSFAWITDLLTFGFTIALALSAVATADDQALPWPRFRGPDGSGVAENHQPPVDIGPEKNVKWKVAAPAGFSSPIVVGDMLVITAFDDGKLYTIAYRRTDGEELWRTEAQPSRSRLITKLREVQRRRRQSPTASGSFRTLAPVVCFVMTPGAKSCGDMRCRRYQLWEALEPACRQF